MAAAVAGIPRFGFLSANDDFVSTISVTVLPAAPELTRNRSLV